MGRRCLQSHLYFDDNVELERITRAFRTLITERLITKQSWPDKQRRFDTYELSSATESDIEQCVTEIRIGRAIQDAAKIGDIGQDYARTIIIRSGIFTKIAQRSRLGRIRARNGSKVDVVARLKPQPHVKIVFEVKNVYEVFYQKSELFGKLIDTALAEGAFPVLIASHVDKRALELCDQIGLFVLDIKRQVFPNSVSAKRRRALLRAFGPEHRDFVEFGRALHYQDKISDWCLKDIERLRAFEYSVAPRMALWNKSAQRLLDVPASKICKMPLSIIVQNATGQTRD